MERYRVEVEVRVEVQEDRSQLYHFDSKGYRDRRSVHEIGTEILDSITKEWKGIKNDEIVCMVE